jgi:hypothetical protein
VCEEYFLESELGALYFVLCPLSVVRGQWSALDDLKSLVKRHATDNGRLTTDKVQSTKHKAQIHEDNSLRKTNLLQVSRDG